MSVVMSIKSYRMMVMTIGILTVLAACSSNKVATSGQDQRLAVSSSETTRVTEQPFASPMAPRAQSEGGRQPDSASPDRQPSSQKATIATSFSGALSDVFFDFDRFTLRPEARTTLEANAQALQSQRDVNVLIEGHCDERGTQAYNLILGNRRAEAVRQYLQELGIPPSQVKIISYGKERPFCTEQLEDCWQQNRRGHFVVE